MVLADEAAKGAKEPLTATLAMTEVRDKRTLSVTMREVASAEQSEAEDSPRGQEDSPRSPRRRRPDAEGAETGPDDLLREPTNPEGTDEYPRGVDEREDTDPLMSSQQPLVKPPQLQMADPLIPSTSDAGPGLLDKEYLFDLDLEAQKGASRIPKQRIALYLLASLVAAAGVAAAVLKSTGHLMDAEEWVYSPVKSWQLVAPAHEATISSAVGEDARRLGVIDVLCEVVHGRLYGGWISLSDRPGFVKQTDGDMEFFRELPEDEPAVKTSVCWLNSTTTTTTFSTSTTTTTLPELSDVRGSWTIGAPGESCRETCRKMGSHCKERSMAVRIDDLLDGDGEQKEWRKMVGECGETCETVSQAYGHALDVPTIQTPIGACYLSADDREASSYSCREETRRDHRRICYCEDWFDVEWDRAHRKKWHDEKEKLVPWQPWQVVRYGMNPVKGLKGMSSQTVGLKDGCTFVLGRMEGRWLRLAFDEGFMPIYAGHEKVLEYTPNMSHPQPICYHTTTTTTQTSTSTTSMTTTSLTTTTTGWPYILCLAVVRPDSYEVPLVGEQLERGAGIFECNDWEVYAIQRLQIGPPERNVWTSVFSGAPVGISSDGWAANVELFMNFWVQVQKDGKFYRADWTVKADPDAVVFPVRIRQQLRPYTRFPSVPFFVMNCYKSIKAGKDPVKAMYGAVEVYSRGALDLYFLDGGAENCRKNLHWKKWGEDLFMSMCMEHISIMHHAEEDEMELDLWHMLGDQRCLGADCRDPAYASFHPFKSIQEWMECYDLGMSMDR